MHCVWNEIVFMDHPKPQCVFIWFWLHGQCVSSNCGSKSMIYVLVYYANQANCDFFKEAMSNQMVALYDV